MIVTSCVAVEVLPCESCAVQVTVVVPKPNVAGALLVNVTPPQLSVPVGVPKDTVTPAVKLHCVYAPGTDVKTGSSVSFTVTVKLLDDVLPCISVATQFTVVGPTANLLPDAGVHTTE